MNGSWKTTVAGIAALVAALADAVVAMVDGDAATNPDWPIVIAAALAAAGLIFARDNDKSSESVGAK